MEALDAGAGGDEDQRAAVRRHVRARALASAGSPPEGRRSRVAWKVARVTVSMGSTFRMAALWISDVDGRGHEVARWRGRWRRRRRGRPATPCAPGQAASVAPARPRRGPSGGGRAPCPAQMPRDGGAEALRRAGDEDAPARQVRHGRPRADAAAFCARDADGVEHALVGVAVAEGGAPLRSAPPFADGGGELRASAPRPRRSRCPC